MVSPPVYIVNRDTLVNFISHTHIYIYVRIKWKLKYFIGILHILFLLLV